MIAAVAGVSKLGRSIDKSEILKLRRQGKVVTPEDLDIRRSDANRNLLSAKSVNDLVTWSGGLYNPPEKFRSW